MEQEQRERQKNRVLMVLISLFVISLYMQHDQEQIKKENYSKQQESDDLQNIIANNDFNNSNQTLELRNPMGLLSVIQNIQFISQWKADYNLLDYFDSKSGKILFFTQPTIFIDSQDLIFIIFDTEYNDDRQIQILSQTHPNNTSYDPTNKTLYIKNAEAKVFTAQNFLRKTQLFCFFDFSIQFQENILEQIFQDVTQKNIQFNIEGTSQDCHIQFKANQFAKNTTNFIQRALNYSMLISVISCIHLISIARCLRDVMENESQGLQYSIISIAMITIFDSYLCMFNFFLAMNVQEIFQYCILPSFIYFILFSIFETRMLILVWKAHYYPGSNHNPDEFRQEIVKFYTKFYMVLIISWFLLFNYIMTDWMMILVNLYLLPQIIHKAYQGVQHKTKNQFIYGLMLSRSLIPLYFRGLDHNIYNVRPNYTICFIIILIVSIQVFILFLQNYYGPQFFIPSYFLPKKHQYFKKIPAIIDLEKGLQGQHAQFFDDCVICMNPLNTNIETSNQTSQSQTPFLNRIKNQKNTIMEAPCGHIFHVNCLIDWMSIKMECPTCRGNLPPI